MQHLDSGWDREPIEVSDLCPTIAIRRKLGDVHVGTRPDEVEALIREAARTSKDKRVTPELTDESIRFALWQHAENRAEYAYVMGPGR